jgi:hypothetical protein
MTATPETATTVVSPTRAPRGVFLRHHRRKYPDTGRCAFCGGSWLARVEDRLVEGCEARQRAATSLAIAGQLDQRGHLIPSPPDSGEQSGAC